MRALSVTLACTAFLAGTAAPPARANHDTLCERLAIEPTCDTLPELEERYQCWAVPAMSARKDSEPDASGMLWWIVEAWGFHGCPDSSGDIVRVDGRLLWTFDGQGWALPPRTCTGYGTCTSYSQEYDVWAPTIAVGYVHVATGSADRPDGGNADTADYLFT
jgi:hypothetical protein